MVIWDSHRNIIYAGDSGLCTSGFTSLRAGPKMSDLEICAVYLGGSGLRCAGGGFGLGCRAPVD